MLTNLERAEKYAELYRQVVKMHDFADTDMWGYSKERDDLLKKIYHLRMDCIQDDIDSNVSENDKWQQFLDQANLKWSSEPQRSLH